jgi:RNA polymerase sigma-70 factor (ECF subfamily)
MPEISAKPGEYRSVDNDALEALAERFRPLLLGYFRRRVASRVEAEDLVQEVFLRLLRRGGADALADARAYLFETAVSVFIDRNRRGKVRRKKDHEAFDSETHGGADFPSERVCMGREALSRVSAALLELPERTRTIFVLRRLEDMKYSDIARRLGISVSAVEKQMVRAMAHLTERMGDA